MMPDAVADAARSALGGHLVVFPTDTVYGLGTRPDDATATARIFEAKRRSPGLALPVLAPTMDQIRSVAELDERAERLAHALWPGALTLVLPRSPGSASWHLGGDASTVGVRIPAHPLALAVLTATGPLAVTSANRSGETPATTCGDLRDAFGELVEVYLCEDAPLVGTSSTVLDLAHDAPTLIRLGDLDRREIERFLPVGEPLLDSPPSP